MDNFLKYLFLCVILCCSAHTWAARGCVLEKANYSLAADNSFTAGFKPVDTYDDGQSLAWFVKSRASNSTYWFAFETGNGFYSFNHIVPIQNLTETADKVVRLSNAASTQPLRMDFFTMSRTLKVRSNDLKQGEQAPPYIFVPALVQNLYYSRHLLTASQSNASEREILPLGVFELTGCAQ